jgi:hypothetical protein
VLEHGARVDVLLTDPACDLAAAPEAVQALGVRPVDRDLADARGLVHDPVRLAAALCDLLESR